jgi:hypothetical protein
VITGRGRNSPGPPVLRGEIEDLLRELRSSVVEDFTLDPWLGSFVVTLRRPDRVRRPAPSPAARPPRDAGEAELLRAAREALAELGVQPTPELLAAEIRRLRRER